MATPHRLRHHVGVFRSVPAYMHEAMVAAYVRDATFAPMDDETLAPYVAPWLGAEGQEAFYRQIAQNDPRYTANRSIARRAQQLAFTPHGGRHVGLTNSAFS